MIFKQQIGITLACGALLMACNSGNNSNNVPNGCIANNIQVVNSNVYVSCQSPATGAYSLYSSSLNQPFYWQIVANTTASNVNGYFLDNNANYYTSYTSTNSYVLNSTGAQIGNYFADTTSSYNPAVIYESTIYFSGNIAIESTLISANSTLNWSMQQAVPATVDTFINMTINQNNGDIYLLGANQGNIYYLANGTTTWQTYANSLGNLSPNNFITSIAASNSNLYIAIYNNQTGNSSVMQVALANIGAAISPFNNFNSSSNQTNPVTAITVNSNILYASQIIDNYGDNQVFTYSGAN